MCFAEPVGGSGTLLYAPTAMQKGVKVQLRSFTGGKSGGSALAPQVMARPKVLHVPREKQYKHLQQSSFIHWESWQ